MKIIIHQCLYLKTDIALAKGLSGSDPVTRQYTCLYSITLKRSKSEKYKNDKK